MTDARNASIKAIQASVDAYSYLLIPLVFLVSIWIQLYTLPWVDLAWLSWGVEELLHHHGVLYKNIWEPNPPLIYWLYAPVVLLADYFAWSLVITLKMVTIGLAGAALFLCSRLLRRSTVWQGKQRRSLMIAIAGILLLTPDNLETFGQREHWFVILSLPYLLMYLPSIGQQAIARPLQILLAVMAGIGLCIKPTFFVIWLALIAYKIVQRRSLWVIGLPEGVILAIAGAYVAILWFYVPQVFEWGRMLLQVYGDNGVVKQTTGDKILSFVILLLLAAFALWKCGVWRIKPSSPYGKDSFYLLWMAAGAFLEALVQFKTWHYIIYPWQAYGVLALATVLALKPMTDANINIWIIVIMTWVFHPLTPMEDSRQEDFNKRYPLLMQALEPYKNAADIYYFSLTFAPPQLYVTQPPLRWSSGFGFYHFMLMGMMERSPVSGYPTIIVRPEKKPMEDWLFNTIADDMERKNPALIIVHRLWNANESLGDSFDFMAWFAKSPRIMQIFSHYTFQKEVELCADPKAPNVTSRCSYRIYTRNSLP